MTPVKENSYGTHPERPSCRGSDLPAGNPRPALRARVPDGHVLATLMDEHQRLLAKLDRLELLVQRGSRTSDVAERPALLEEIRRIAAELIAAEPHHRREEEVLFPALERQGIRGPGAVMTAEHVELRTLKHALQDCALAALELDEVGWSEVCGVANALSHRLREHIFKEDNVLYPLAFNAIREPAVWAELARRCDEIGYCCHAH